MKLYDAAWAPSPRRVRIYLAEKGIAVEREVIDLRADQQLEPDYLKVNPRGVVPALLLDDGEVITESGAICRYFEAVQPDPPLFGSTPVEIARIESWTRRIEHEGYDGVVKVLRNAIPAMRDRGLPGKWPVIPQIPSLIDRGTIMWKACLESLDAQLADSEWITGDMFSFADITALVTLDFARAAKLTVPEACSHIARWYQAAAARAPALLPEDIRLSDSLTLEVHDIEVPVLTGIYSEETHLPQPLRISITAQIDCSARFAPDTPLGASKNYLDLKRAATELPAGVHFTLIEGVADHICGRLFESDSRVARVTVRIVKLAIAEHGESIGITLVRGRP